MAQKELIIVKLGGSIVTQKEEKHPALRRNHLKKVAAVLAKGYDPKKHAMILIHGAGSFGHPHAHKYELTLGLKKDPRRIYRATENFAIMERLNSELAVLFNESGLPVCGMPTRTLAQNKAGKLFSLETKTLSAALKVSAIPLLHGDVVFDSTLGFSVCSGDTLASNLARSFGAKKVFFASDVDGVFSRDPHLSKDATLFRSLPLVSVINGAVQLGKSRHIDVTGGLSKKFSTFQRIPKLKNIFFFNGLVPENFSFLFDQKNFFGTTLFIKKAR